MLPETKQKWVAALREPGRRQCYNRLHDKDTGAMCVMGVFYDVMGVNWATYGNYNSFDAQCAQARSKAQMERTPEINGLTIVYLNDVAQLSFLRLSEMIECSDL